MLFDDDDDDDDDIFTKHTIGASEGGADVAADDAPALESSAGKRLQRTAKAAGKSSKSSAGKAARKADKARTAAAAASASASASTDARRTSRATADDRDDVGSSASAAKDAAARGTGYLPAKKLTDFERAVKQVKEDRKRLSRHSADDMVRCA